MSVQPIDHFALLRDLLNRMTPADWFIVIVLTPVMAVIMRELYPQLKKLGLPDDDKPKNKTPLDRFSVPYDQDADDDKPKRQTYMTIGDDGELVEMDE